MSSSSLASIGPEARFHALSCATRLGNGLEGDEGAFESVKDCALVEGEEPGEVSLVAGADAAEEPLECVLVESSTEFCRLPFHLDCDPFTYDED